MSRGRKLLIITIEIGNGRQEQLTIYENDNLQEVAEDFCSQHNYGRDLRDMLQYQIENTVYETKLKLIQKERSPEFSTHFNELPEVEIPLEVTYSESGVYSKFTPKNDTLQAMVNMSDEIERTQDQQPSNSEYYGNQNNTHEDGHELIMLKDEENIDESDQNPRHQQQYMDYPDNIPESGKKFMLSQKEMPMNIPVNNSLLKKASKHKILLHHIFLNL